MDEKKEKIILRLVDTVLNNYEFISFLSAGALATIQIYSTMVVMPDCLKNMDAPKLAKIARMNIIIRQFVMEVVEEDFKDEYIKIGASFIEMLEKTRKDINDSEEELEDILKQFDIKTNDTNSN